MTLPAQPACDGISCFSATFALLGLKLLFGSKPVTIGSVVLLAAISAAVAQAWVGGTGAWVEVSVMNVVNRTLLGGSWLSGDTGDALLRKFMHGLKPDFFPSATGETEVNEL